MSVVPLSAIVLTSNEAANVGACLATLDWTDERVIVDSFSTDGTVGGDGSATRVVERRFADFASQRQAALVRATHDWVLFVDADERVPPSLADEIQRRAGAETHAGYWIPRRNRIFGHWMRASGWSPDRQLRLMDRRHATYRPDRPVHELVYIHGSVGRLHHSLEHLGYETVASFRRRQLAYAGLFADEQFSHGVRRRPSALLAQPLREFGRRLFRLRGYRDGLTGLLLAALMAEYEWHVQRRLRVLRKGAARA